MRWNRPKIVIGVMLVLPVLVVAGYLAVPRASRQEAYRQTVVPVAADVSLPAEEQETKPARTQDAKTTKAIHAAIAKSLGTPPALNVIEEKKEDRGDKSLPRAEPPLLAADVTANPGPALPPVTNPGVPAPPEIRTVSAGEPFAAPPPPPGPAVRIVDSPPPPGASPKPADVEVKCPWTLRLEVVKGRTILTAEAGKDARFRVECDLLELKAPQGNIRASGNVKISSEALEGKSDRLTVNLQEDQVFLEGGAALVARRQGENMEIRGERLSLRLVKTGGAVEEKTAAKK